jgi:hypothetical protein
MTPERNTLATTKDDSFQNRVEFGKILEGLSLSRGIEAVENIFLLRFEDRYDILSSSGCRQVTFVPGMFIKRFDDIFPATERFGDQLSQLYMLPFTHVTMGKEDAISTKCSATLHFRIGQERKTVNPFRLKPKISRR